MDLLDLVRSRITGGQAIRTPCYVYSPEIAATNHSALSTALGTPVIASLKANPNVDLLLRLKAALDPSGFEVASFRELNLVAGHGEAPVYLNTPAMSSQLMQAGIGARARLVLDSEQQVDRLIGLTARKNALSVLLRLNTGSAAEFGTANRRRDQFGMAWRDLLDQAKRLQGEGLKVAGFHLFAGSNSFAAHGASTLRAAGRLIAELEDRLGEPIQMANLGGGFGPDWRRDVDAIERYREGLAELPRHVLYQHEAGRAIFATAGLFVTQVVGRKQVGNDKYFVCDGGIAQNFLVCGTENRMRKAAVARLVGSSKEDSGNDGGVVVGSTCSHDDVLGVVPAGTGDPIVGDMLAFENCGAYNSTYPNNGFLSLEAAGSYLVS